MRQLTVSESVQIVRGLRRVGEAVLAEQLLELRGCLFVAESEAECEQLHAACIPPAGLRFSLTPSGRDALHPCEGS